jgi:CheY-like chemotaxis protein
MTRCGIPHYPPVMATVFNEECRSFADFAGRVRPSVRILNPPMSKPSILVVDDEEDAVGRVSAILASEDFDVEGFTSPGQALARLRTRRFDVVVTDYRMPGMNGMELLRAVATLRPSTEQVLVTDAAELFLKEHEDAGQVVYLFKPYKPASLIELVRRLARVAQSCQPKA